MAIWTAIRQYLFGAGSSIDDGIDDDPRRDRVEERRLALEETGLAIDPEAVPPGAMGLAFSGGGIRSATISLGATQALVEDDQLLDFDYCSTVSGGGYFGSFLTSLFLPDWARGPSASPRPKDSQWLNHLRDKKDIAFDALSAKARSINLDNPGGVQIGTIRNPIWWLREHSRYLAPNGTSDYLVAAVYTVRGWLAMIYVMSLPIAGVALLAIGLDNWVLQGPAALPDGLVALGKALVSPLWIAVLLLAFLALSASVAFWSSETMSHKARNSDKKRGLFHRILEAISRPRIAMMLSAIAGMAAAPLLLWLLVPARDIMDIFASIVSLSPLQKTVVFGGALLATSSFIAYMIAFSAPREFEGNALVAEIRRRITLLNVTLVKWMLILAAIAAVNTAAILAFHWLIGPEKGQSGLWATISAALLPVIAWIINKVQDWGKDKDSLVKRVLGRSIWTIALIAGVSMFAILAVSLHIFLQHLLFGTDSWRFGETGPGWTFATLFLLLGLLVTATGLSTGFINLSSLHGIYASRLTRAYLGASNIDRLQKAANPELALTSIKDSDPFDQIPVSVYQRTIHLGPLHLINVTLNETRSAEGSQLLERDRKGVPMVFAPEGVFVNAARERAPRAKAEARSWRTLDRANVEALSVGQLCAISGAAASTAMGSMTTLGGSLAMSFANIRLGYWWDVKGLFRKVPRFWSEPLTWLYQKGTRPLRTYFYLFNELIGNYTRENARLNLSDGGHFDNSGAYELLRRDVRAIVVCDNGADPDFRFGDLEVLIRKARIDLGLAIEVASPDTVQAVMGQSAVSLFLNGDTRDWRARAAARCDRAGASSPQDRAYCLLLEAKGFRRNWPDARILWIKPRLFADLPQDVIGYALAHQDFPHETTGDQFFNEAQWESYRALGHAMMKGLLEGRPQVLRNLIPRKPPPKPRARK